MCTANICRSPLAEALLRHRLGDLGLEKRVRVRSAGTQAARRGCRPDPRVQQLAAGFGISLAGIRARALTPALLHNSDFVVVMAREHLDHINRVFARDAWSREGTTDGDVSEKVQLLGSFLPRRHGSAVDIPDPYYGDQQGFYTVHQMIDSALSGFLHQLDAFLENSETKMRGLAP